MALTPTEEALTRQLIAQTSPLLSLAISEPQIVSSLGATEVTIDDLDPATSVGVNDLFVIRQGTQEKRATAAQLFDGADDSIRADLANYTEPSLGSSLIPSTSRVVDFIAMVNASGLPDGTEIFAKNRDALGDGGGGTAYYSASSTAAVDGGIVFAPSSGSGRIIRRGYTVFGFNGLVQAKWFGARGDNTTLDTAALQVMINACSPRKERMRISAGVYTTSSLTVYQDSDISGDGVGKTLLKHIYSIGNDSCFKDATTQTASIRGVSISDLTIDGDSYDQAVDTHGIYLKNVNGTRIKRVDVKNFSRIGVHVCGAIAGSGGLGADDNWVSETNVSRIKLGDAFNHAGNNTHYDTCYAEDFGDTGFAIIQDSFGVYGAGRSTGTTYLNCHANGAKTISIGTHLGFGWGPFEPNFDANIFCFNCSVKNCNVSLWGISFLGLRLMNCDFGRCGANDTGNVRLDGVGKFSISGGKILGALTAGAGQGSCLLLNSDRFVFGASNFDANTALGYVGGGIVIESDFHDHVRVDIGTPVVSPAFTPVSTLMNFGDVIFAGTGNAFAYRPASGNPDQITEWTVKSCTKANGSWLSANGTDSTYSGVKFILNNLSPGVTNQSISLSPSGITYDFGYRVGVGVPVGNLLPRCIQDRYTDASTGNPWMAFGLANTQWKQLA